MKPSVRFLVLLTAILLALPCFASCGDAEQPKETQTTQESAIFTDVITEETETPDVHPYIEQNNYDDICYMAVYERPKNLWTEQREGDVFTEAMFARQVKVQEYLGVEFIAKYLPSTEIFTTAVKNKDGSIDVLMSSPYLSVANFVLEGQIRKYNDLTQLELDADYWRMDYMEELMLEGDIYLGYSDFNIFNTHVVSFNKVMLDKYSHALDESLYDSVRNYRWTIDKMISLAKLVYIDTSSDGKTIDDTFGFTGRQWIPYIGFLHACDIFLVEQNEKGEYEVAVFNEKNQAKTSDLVSKLYDLAKSDCSWLSYKNEGPDMIYLISGRSLMTLVETGNLVGYLDYELEFGVLPYPMYDENQKDVGYRSFNYDGFITFPAYMRNEAMTAETIEMLSFFSAPVQSAYYEKQLGKQAADTPDDREMLQLVWDGICTDFGLAFSYISSALDTNLYMLPTLTYVSTESQVASYVKSYENSANKAIAKYIQKYSMRQD